MDSSGRALVTSRESLPRWLMLRLLPPDLKFFHIDLRQTWSPLFLEIPSSLHYYCISLRIKTLWFQDSVTDALYQMFKEYLVSVIHNSLQRIEKEYRLSKSFCKARIILILNLKKMSMIKENYRPILLWIYLQNS